MSLGCFLRENLKSVGKTAQFLRDGLKSGRVRQQNLSLLDLAKTYLGGERWKENLARTRERAAQEGYLLREDVDGKFVGPLAESTVDAVTPSAFYAITGQLLVDKVREKYQDAEFVGDELFQEVTTTNLTSYIEPYLSDVVDPPDQLEPLQPYPTTRFSPQYVTYPPPQKFGLVCLVSVEMIISDLTKQAMDSAGSVGRRVRLNEEYKKLRVFAGLVNNHSWNGSSYNTYQTSTPWINTKSGQTILDWTQFNEIEKLAQQMTDPVTGLPIEIDVNTILTVPGKYYDLAHAIRGSTWRTGNFATSGGNQQIEGPSQLRTQYKILTSKHLYYLLTLATASGGGGLTATQANQYVFFFDRRAFTYRRVWPLKVEEAPPKNPMDYWQDVAFAVKASEFGVAGVTDPRRVFLSYAS